jgi:hypothetical protein
MIVMMTYAHPSDAAGGLERVAEQARKGRAARFETVTKSGNGHCAVVIEDLDEVLDRDSCPMCSVHRASVDAGLPELIIPN